MGHVENISASLAILADINLLSTIGAWPVKSNVSFLSTNDMTHSYERPSFIVIQMYKRRTWESAVLLSHIELNRSCRSDARCSDR